MTAFHTIDLRLEPGVAWITLSRPEVHNALNLQMRDELWAALDVIEADDDARVAAFEGAGASFSAGADVTEFGTTASLHLAREARRQRDLWLRLERFPKPMLAGIRGWALGAGLELALYCDLRIAADDARFGLPEVSLGYIPSAGGTQTLARTVGLAPALRLGLTGEPIHAAEALRMGLVAEVVPVRDVHAALKRRAATILLRTPLALRYARDAIRSGNDLTLEAGLALERRLASILISTGNADTRT
jgi:enoyl-CoA hydratase/carnithine racemase